MKQDKVTVTSIPSVALVKKVNKVSFVICCSNMLKIHLKIFTGQNTLIGSTFSFLRSE